MVNIDNKSYFSVSNNDMEYKKKLKCDKSTARISRRLTTMNTGSQKIRCVDLFAGAGGFSCAARNIGLNIIAALEFDHHACETYRANFINGRKNAPLLFEKDITTFPPSKFLNIITQKIGAGPIDVVFGGPPCQGFSTHRINNAGVDDPRNKLLLRYFEYIRVLNPEIFVLENVSGLLWKRHRKYLLAFYRYARKNGYTIKPPIIIDAKNYGVPQSRKRVFILGYRRGSHLGRNFAWPPAPTHFNPRSNKVINGEANAWVNASIVFHQEERSDDINNIHMNHSAEMIDVFASTPINGGSRKDSNRQLPCHEKHNGHKDVYGRICMEKPGPTMTTGCINPSKGRFLHPFENHGITVRQAARFQTFPENFIFLGGLMSSSKQVGNAVPVKLAEIILGQIKTEIERRKSRRRNHDK